MRNLFTGIILACLLAGCSEGPGVDAPNIPDSEKPIPFVLGIHSSDVQTRVTGSSWDEEDKVGIYMLPHSNEEAANFVAAYKKNVQYEAIDNGETVTFEPIDEVLLFTNNYVNFVAYYPYTKGLDTEENLYPVDVSSQESPAAIDVLYHNGVGKAYNVSSEEDVLLAFRHQMGKINIWVLPEPDSDVEVDLSSVSARLVGFPTTANLDLKDGTYAGHGGEDVDIQPRTVSDPLYTPDVVGDAEEVSSFEAILVPHQGSDYDRKVILNIEGKDYPYTLRETRDFIPGESLNYIFYYTGRAVVLGLESIVDWDGGVVLWGNYMLTANRSLFQIPSGKTINNRLNILTTAPDDLELKAEISNLKAEVEATGTEWIESFACLENEPVTGDDGTKWRSYTVTFDTQRLTDAFERRAYIHINVGETQLIVDILQTAYTADFGGNNSGTVDDWIKPPVPEGTVEDWDKEPEGPENNLH